MAEAREQAALAPKEPYWPYRMGELYLAADSIAKAEAALRASLDNDPGYAPALALISKLYYDTGRHQDAIRLLEAARTRAGDVGLPPALLAGLALHYEAMDRPDLSRQALAGVPRTAGRGTVSALVYVLLRGDRPDSASGLAVAARDDNPRSAANQNNFGITRLRAGDPEGARKAFTEAIRIDPKLPGPYYNLAILEKFYALDDAAGAKWYRAYRERSSNDPDSLAAVFGKPASHELAGEENSPR
jgi:tetratricopeptide (TPR) repeat protein